MPHWGGGNAPFTYLSAYGEGDTHSPHPTVKLRGKRRALGERRPLQGGFGPMRSPRIRGPALHDFQNLMAPCTKFISGKMLKIQ